MNQGKKNKAILLMFFYWMGYSAAGQDTLLLKSGSEVYGKVIEIGSGTIQYRRKDNPDGPIYDINKSAVFMIFFKNGKRESIISDDKEQVKNGPANQLSSDKFISLTEGLYETELIKARVEKDKNDNAIIVTGLVKVNYNSIYFDSLSIYIYQAKNGIKDYSTPNAKYLKNNYINMYMSSSHWRQVLYERYENELGKGYGWAIPPNFFSENDLSDCEIALLEQKSANKEILGFGGISYTKLKLADCSTIEKRILSASLKWLEVNFGVK